MLTLIYDLFINQTFTEDDSVGTTGGTGNGCKCVFPFEYDGRSYNSCTSIDHFQPWCSCKAKYDRGAWGNCVPSEYMAMASGAIPTHISLLASISFNYFTEQSMIALSNLNRRPSFGPEAYMGRKWRQVRSANLIPKSLMFSNFDGPYLA